MKHSGYLTTSGAEIYYEQYGSGTPLLILHGNSQSLAVFYPFLRTFLTDFQVILMDSRGHGRSRLSVHTALKVGKVRILGGKCIDVLRLRGNRPSDGIAPER